ncbi:hypothetical protein [Phenylobacterium sp.]|jgi:hypothetical protein|uniref:hypothetical protein n=1 Tax=Phenylobacterium sp. TaxID=1871053 RepID=UPI002F41402F
MSDASTVNATEFVRHVTPYREEAIANKIIVATSHERVVGGYLSASELAHYRRLKAREREVLCVGELDDETLAEIAAAEYGREPARRFRLRSRGLVIRYNFPWVPRGRRGRR